MSSKRSEFTKMNIVANMFKQPNIIKDKLIKIENNCSLTWECQMQIKVCFFCAKWEYAYANFENSKFIWKKISMYILK